MPNKRHNDALAFLEKNKDLYPDAYARAQKLCTRNDCLSMSEKDDEAFLQIRLAATLKGLLRGISKLEGGL